jgi:hypothetical protein
MLFKSIFISMFSKNLKKKLAIPSEASDGDDMQRDTLSHHGVEGI